MRPHSYALDSIVEFIHIDLVANINHNQTRVLNKAVPIEVLNLLDLNPEIFFGLIQNYKMSPKWKWFIQKLQNVTKWISVVIEDNFDERVHFI